MRVAAPKLAALMAGPVFSQVSQTFAYGKGLVQRHRLAGTPRPGATPMACSR